jgi:toxin ParE1/3/4
VAQVRPLTLRVTRRAAAHIESIEAYIANENPGAARDVGRRIRAAFEMLCHFPDMGRRGKVSGTREWLVRRIPYVVVYAISESSVDILGVFHCARNDRNG